MCFVPFKLDTLNRLSFEYSLPFISYVALGLFPTMTEPSYLYPAFT